MTTGSNSNRSATGATLSASFEGATGTISETGFLYGATSDINALKSNGTKAYNNVSLSSAEGNFTKAITGLTANTTYNYLAYVKEHDESQNADVIRYASSAQSFTTLKVATATVTTAAASNIQPTTATFNGSFSGATGTIYDRGFYYKKTSESTWTKVALNSTTGTSGSFNYNVSGLAEGTTYQVKAYVTEWDENQGAYVDKEGSVVTFMTTTSSVVIPTYLDDYGIPDVSSILSGTGTSGTNTSVGDNWYRYNTTSNNRQIAVHTCDETVNYVVMYDGSRYAPLWTAHTMNTTYWPDKSVGRNESWTKDPAISLTQQTGLDNAGTVGYSKGHLVASEYRQTTVNQNKQTFYYSNQAPQWQDGFNGSATGGGDGVWQQLENRVKNQAPSGTTMMYVVTGVLYEGTTTTLPSGSLNVPIPSHFYKCIMKCTLNGSGTVTAAQGIAFVYTNVSHAGEKYYDSAYVTTIDAIEARAGFDFFAKVPASLQNAAESNKNHTWFTGQSSSNIDAVTDNNWGTL